MQPVEALYGLQQLDQRVTSIEREMAEIAPLLQVTALQKALDADRTARTRVAESEKRAEMGVRRSEGDAADAREKLRALEQEMYGGAVASPKELRNMETKASDFKRRADEAEEEAFSLLEEVERHHGELAEIDARISERERAIAKLQEEGESVRQEIELRLGLAKAERDGARDEIDPDWLSLYDRLYGELRGAPIARVVGGVCQGCRVSLPTSLLGKVRTNAHAVRCDQCGRLLCSAG